MGDILAEQGDLNGAMRKYDQAMSIQRSIGSRSYYAGTLNSLGQVLRQKGDADGAKKTLNEALAIRQECEQGIGLGDFTAQRVGGAEAARQDAQQQDLGLG